MNWAWVRQIVEDEKGRASTNRVAYLWCILTMSIIMLYLTYADRMTEGYFGIFNTILGAVFVGGKWVDKGEKNDSSSNRRV